MKQMETNDDAHDTNKNFFFFFLTYYSLGLCCLTQIAYINPDT